MDLLQLKYFQTVAYTQHISKSAEKLKIAQPSLSLMIKRLEDELGTSLFDRKGRNIYLNDSGKAFLKHVNIIFSEIENAKMEVQEIDKEKNNTIKISISNTRFLSGLIGEYFNECPEGKIQQCLGTRESIEVKLKKGEIDLGIAGPPIKSEVVESCVLMEEDIVLVFPPNHRFANQETIDLKKAAAESFISLADNEEYRTIVNNLCLSAGFTPRVNFEVDYSLLLEMLELGKGVGLVPITICKKHNLNYRRISNPESKFIVGLSWIKGKNLSPITENFKNFIISFYKNVISE